MATASSWPNGSSWGGDQASWEGDQASWGGDQASWEVGGEAPSSGADSGDLGSGTQGPRVIAPRPRPEVPDPTIIPGHFGYLNLPATAIGMVLKGTVIQNRISYGFCKVDFEDYDAENQYQTFIVPAECRNVGDSIPPIGARIQFTIVADAKSGRPRASQVEVAPGEEQPVGIVPEENMQMFIDRWALGENAQAALHRCAPDVQQVVMSTFAPRDMYGKNALTAADLLGPCDGKFILFCRSVAIGKGVKGGGCNFVKGAKGEAKGFAKGKIDKGRSSQMQGTVAELQQSVRAFIDTWNLNPEAQTVLSNLNLQVAVEAMKKFRPLTMTGEHAKNYMDLGGADCSGFFCDFARNMEAKLVGGGLPQPGMDAQQQLEAQLQSTNAAGMVDVSQLPGVMGSMDGGMQPSGVQPDAMGNMRFSPY